MRIIIAAWQPCAMFCLSLLLAATPVAAAPAGQGFDPPGFPLATNIQQLRRLALSGHRVLCSLGIEGVVCSANAATGRLILQDDSGAELLEMDLPKRSLSPGDRVKLEAEHCSVVCDGSRLIIGKAAVVDNDGIHPMLRRSGTVYLGAGRHPVRLLWFNGSGQYGLKVSYQGPGLNRQKIPDSALFRPEVDPTNGVTNTVRGLNYRCFEGPWINLLSEFGQSKAVKAGHTDNFDLRIRTRDEHVGLEFGGYLEVSREGLYTFDMESDDGSLLFVGEPAPNVEWLGAASLPIPRHLMVGQMLDEENEQWTEVEGTVAFANETAIGWNLELRAETGRMKLVVADASGLSPSLLLNRRVRAAGIARGVQSLEGPRVFGLLMVLSGKDILPVKAGHGAAEALPLLTTGDQIKSLKREEAQRGYPVRVRGVITRSARPWHDTVVIQDATCGVFARDVSKQGLEAPQLGEYWEVEGTTAPGDFAPVINWRNGRRLGTGRLPEPVAATWDQLMNGSLDTQYVEIVGVVTGVGLKSLQLLLPEGKINLGFLDREPGTLNGFENTLIRVRGCLFPAWNAGTHRLIIGEMNIASAAISIEATAAPDLFTTPTKQLADLLIFDPGARVLKRVKVAGQLLGTRDGQCFMTDGTNGLRFQTQTATNFRPGDLVEVVGFPKLEGSSPLLREAVARKIAQARLPPPRTLGPDNLLDAGYDATLVRVDGLLINLRTEGGEPVLELQTGLRTFVARLGKNENLSESLRVGSRIRLTGVYLAQGGNRALGQAIDSFELLVNSTADINVLAQPPWLTLHRVLVALGGVALVLLGSMLWALSLRRQVSVQTAIIRQKAQREVALEERSRIAKDIHDELGSSLTRIMLLSQRVKSDLSERKAAGLHLEKIIIFSRGAIQAMDEIVWAVNPRNDNFDGLVNYLIEYAAQFFKGTEIRCRLQMPVTSQLSLATEVRHDLFLAFKEGLNNVLKHSQASEVHVEVFHADSTVNIIIDDNGCGFDMAERKNGRQGNGLQNMRKRLDALGGRMEIITTPGHGTKLQFIVHVPAPPPPN